MDTRASAPAAPIENAEPRSDAVTKKVRAVPTLHAAHQRLPSGDSTPAARPVSSAPRLDLYTTDGQVRLPETAPALSAEIREFPTRTPRGDPFARRNPLPYTPTRLDRLWLFPRGETLAGELTRKATVSHTWRTPWGTQITCAWVLIAGGCGWGIPPRAPIEELKRMRADPPMPKSTAEVPPMDEPLAQ
ncbi:hypothetical protein [Dokdonella soli]